MRNARLLREHVDDLLKGASLTAQPPEAPDTNPRRFAAASLPVDNSTDANDGPLVLVVEDSEDMNLLVRSARREIPHYRCAQRSAAAFRCAVSRPM